MHPQQTQFQVQSCESEEVYEVGSFPSVTSLTIKNKHRIKITVRTSHSGWQFGGDNDKCKFNDMFSSAFSFSGNFLSVSTSFYLQDVETALHEGMDSVTGITRSERRRGLCDKPLALSRIQTAVIDVVRDSSKSHEDKRIARRTEHLDRKKCELMNVMCWIAMAC